MVKRPCAATASLVDFTTSSAAAANSSCGVLRMRIVAEELTHLTPSASIFASAYGRASRRAHQTGFVISDNVHRHRLNQGTHASLIEKRFHEKWSLQFRKNLRRDAPAQIEAAGRHCFERQV